AAFPVALAHALLDALGHLPGLVAALHHDAVFVADLVVADPTGFGPVLGDALDDRDKLFARLAHGFIAERFAHDRFVLHAIGCAGGLFLLLDPIVEEEGALFLGRATWFLGGGGRGQRRKSDAATQQGSDRTAGHAFSLFVDTEDGLARPPQAGAW